MKSGRQRGAEIAERRRVKARAADRLVMDPPASVPRIPVGALPADQSKLLHDKSYGPRPLYYVDTPFTCIDCGTREIWTAAAQKWWYEEAKGKVASRATRCATCRRPRRENRLRSSRIHVEGLIARYGLEVAARRLNKTVVEVEEMRKRWARPHDR